MEYQVYFETNELKDAPLENDQVGEAIELAKWLCDILPPSVNADYLGEDWGCRLLFSEPYSQTVEITCGHIESSSYSIVCKSNESFWDKLFGRKRFTEETKKVKSLIDKTLKDQQCVSNIEWEQNG